MTDESIFAEALGITDPVARAAYLEHACAGDADLRAAVEGLLAAHAACSPLDRPPESLARTGPYVPVVVAPGDRVGPYKLLEAIGEGGMGEVWMAEQTEPVKRRVALKLIKPGMDTRSVLARFEAERQALALMDHPNIARVFDAGATADGRPFFVMELVKGVPITKFCDEKRLNPRERLELFVQACQAIQHAHQKGIIHRDVKPSNVLVALYDDKPVVKVIDFGVAKATGQPLTDKTLATGFNAVVGTPQYMSPEQATLNNLDIDTRSDVYSLGVLLYELLAGSPPFSRKELEQQGLMEILRVVREEEPPRPSTKLSTADALPTLSANRGTEPRALTALLRGELDWIVMKALEKDRTRRYETANGFAADVQRFLSGEPVLAHPPSVGYRLKKFVRKHRTVAITAAVVLLGAAVGAVGAGVGYVQRERQRETEANFAKLQDEQGKTAVALAAEQQAREDQQRLRAEADRLRLDVAQTEAARTIELAFRSWKEGNLRRAVELLETVPANLRAWEWNYTRRLCEPKVVVIPGYAGIFSSLYFNKDGTKLLFYLSNANNWANPRKEKTCAFETSTGQELAQGKYAAHAQCLTELDPENPLMVVVDPAPEFHYQIRMAKEKADGKDVEVVRLDRIVKTPGPYSLRVIDPFTDRKVASIESLPDFPTVGKVALSRDGHVLAMILSDRSVAVFDT